MTSKILHELTTDKMYQQVPFPILEEISPRELICQVLQETGRWEQREGKLTPVFLI